MRPYQKGDVVTCIKSDNSDNEILVLYKDYTISERNNAYTPGESMLTLEEIRGRFFSSRFRPKYWYVKRTDDPRWQRVIDYLNDTHTPNNKWGGDAFRYYGYDGGSGSGGTNGYGAGSQFKNNAIELTIDEWIKFGYDKDIYKEQSTSQSMEQVTLTRKQLIEIYHRISCGAVRSVIESYLDNYRLGFDDTPCVIKQTDLDRIKELNSEQKKVVGEYIKLPEPEVTYKVGQYFDILGHIYRLIEVKEGVVTLLTVDSGRVNGFNDSYNVRVGNTQKITKQEVLKMAGTSTITLTPIEVTITKKS